MQWVAENWIALLLVGGMMIAMHLFGHGHSHGGHSKRKPKQNAKVDDPTESDPEGER